MIFPRVAVKSSVFVNVQERNCPSFGVKFTVLVPRLVVKLPTPKPPSVCVQDRLVRLNSGAEACGSDSVTVRAVASVRLNTCWAGVVPLGGVSENEPRLFPVVV